MNTTTKTWTPEQCPGGEEAHWAHIDANDECPWCIEDVLGKPEVVVEMSIASNQGYSADQVINEMTLGELLEEVQEAITKFGESAKIVLNSSQPYSANYGNLPSGTLFTEVGDEEEL